MKTSLEVYRPEMFEEIYHTFLKDDDPGTPRETWRRLFDHHWDDQRECKAYVLCDGPKVVGVLGTLFSRRNIDGCHRWLCNLHNWHVKEAYRGRSLLMLRPVLKEADLTLTDFSATRQVSDLVCRIGFQPMDGRVRLLPTIRRRSKPENVVLMTETSELRAALSSAEQKILDDHQDKHWCHVLASKDDTSCYVVASLVRRHWRPYAYVHYLNCPNSFRQMHRPIRRFLARHFDVQLVVLDDRRFNGATIPGSVRIPKSSIQLFRGECVEPSQIDNLYSEVAVLGLTTFPSIRSLLARDSRP